MARKTLRPAAESLEPRYALDGDTDGLADMTDAADCGPIPPQTMGSGVVSDRTPTIPPYEVVDIIGDVIDLLIAAEQRMRDLSDSMPDGPNAFAPLPTDVQPAPGPIPAY